MFGSFNEWTQERRNRHKILDRILASGQEIPSLEDIEATELELAKEYDYYCRTCDKYFERPRGTRCPHCGRHNCFDKLR